MARAFEVTRDIAKGLIIVSAALIDTITTEGGFTYDLTSGRLLRVGQCGGFMIAIPGTEMLLGPADLTREQFAARFAALVTSAAVGNGVYVGGWLSPDRGFLIELSERFDCDRETAIAIGTARNQEAILDLATGELISTGGTGDGATAA